MSNPPSTKRGKKPASQFDDVLKRMLASPPDPKKRAKPVKKDEKKKPA